MAANLKIRRVVLYKHGVGYFERRGQVTGSDVVHLDFKARDMNDVLKSMTVLDLSGGAVSAVSYDSTKPLEKLLEEATIRIPPEGSLTALLAQVKGARIRARVGGETVEGAIVGLQDVQLAQGETTLVRPHVTILEKGALRTYDLMDLKDLEFLDATVRGDIEFYLSTVLSSYKKDSKRVSVFASGDGQRELFVSYTLESPVWKTSYRALLDEKEPPVLQGWAVIDNTGDEDWVDIDLALIAGLPVSFVHDLYSPRYMQRPVVEVKTEAAAAPVIPEEGFGGAAAEMAMDDMVAAPAMAAAPAPRRAAKMMAPPPPPGGAPMTGARRAELMAKSAPVKTLVKDVGDLFEYRIANPVTVKRNQSALVPIVQQKMEGRRVLLWNRTTREKNPMACIELRNTSELTLEGGPLTVSEGDLYVGEAMLDTMKPGDRRLVPFAVELGCVVSVDDVSDTGNVFRSEIYSGTLRTQAWSYRRTKLRIRSKAKKPQVLFVEHPKSGGWDLVDTPAPFETTDAFYRFKLELQPGETEFVISERMIQYSSYYLGDLSRDTVSFYLSSRFIDKRVADAMEKIISLREKVNALSQDEAKLEQERQQIFNDQQRIRSNIQALTGGPEQRQLTDKLVKKLNQQEDRLEKLASEVEAIREQKGKLERDVAQRISELRYEVDLGEKRAS